MITCHTGLSVICAISQLWCLQVFVTFRQLLHPLEQLNHLFCHGTKGDDALCEVKVVMADYCYILVTLNSFSQRSTRCYHTVCDPLWLRPLICMMPSRGCSLLLQVGDVCGRGGVKEGREWGGGWGGRAKAMWGQIKGSPEYSDIPISCPVSSGLKRQFWTVSWFARALACTHIPTQWGEKEGHITTAFTELICFHLPSVSSVLFFAVLQEIS